MSSTKTGSAVTVGMHVTCVPLKESSLAFAIPHTIIPQERIRISEKQGRKNLNKRMFFHSSDLKVPVGVEVQYIRVVEVQVAYATFISQEHPMYRGIYGSCTIRIDSAGRILLANIR
jgi:hypothetical protein